MVVTEAFPRLCRTIGQGVARQTARAKERIGASQAERSLPQLELKKRWLEKCLKYGRLL